MLLEGDCVGTHLADNLVLDVDQDDLIVLVCGVLHRITGNISTSVADSLQHPPRCNPASALALTAVEAFCLTSNSAIAKTLAKAARGTPHQGQMCYSQALPPACPSNRISGRHHLHRVATSSLSHETVLRIQHSNPPG